MDTVSGRLSLNRGKMDPDALEKEIKNAEDNGHIPLAVVGTAGTTVLGAFDPLDKIADICQAHGVWFHVDVSSECEE